MRDPLERVLAVVTGERGQREIVRPLRAVGIEPAVIDLEELRAAGPRFRAGWNHAIAGAARHGPTAVATDMSSVYLARLLSDQQGFRPHLLMRLRGDLPAERRDQMRFHAARGNLSEWARTAIGLWLDPANVHKVCGVLPVSHWVVDRMRLTANRWRVVGIPCEVGDHDRAPIREIPANDPMRIVAVTNFDYPEKIAPLATFLRAEGRALAPAGLALDVAGDGISLERFRNEFGLLPGVRVLGRVGVPRDFYATYDLFLHLSGLDALPYVVLEAQAAGLPVICSARCGMIEQVTNGITGHLVDDTDPRPVRDLLVSLRANPSRRASLGDAARAHVSRTATHAAIGHELSAAMRDLLGPAAQRG